MNEMLLGAAFISFKDVHFTILKEKLPSRPLQ